MNVVRFSDARAFSEHVGSVLMRQERENNVPLGIIRGLVNTPNDAALMIAIEDSGHPICAAVMTPPFKLVVSSGPPAAAALLAEHLRAEGIAVPGVTANAAMSDAFANAWRQHHAGDVGRGIEIKLFSLGAAPPKPPTLGTLRAATAAEILLLRDWSAEFFTDAGLPPDERDSFIASLDERIAVSRLWLWDNGGPVCMLGHTETTPRTARIGPVFTPRSVRGKGYATAAVSELTRRLLAGGRTWCLLFADVANPTSTDMYRRIGYEEVCLFREYMFDP
jgi:RimJ/RimL family protein N-acetyltransferase